MTKNKLVKLAPEVYFIGKKHHMKSYSFFAFTVDAVRNPDRSCKY